ncbi:MAG TPA: DUF1707 domain-containing protein [Thermoleophilaceae bacterium]|jgi:hypothetical protein
MIEHEHATSTSTATGSAGEHRDDVVAILRDAYSSARLTLGEYTERLTAATSAQTPDEVERAAAELPEAPPVEPDGPHRMVAIMGGSSRRGPWRPGRHTSALAFMGGCHLDLRGAYVDGAVLDVDATAVMGGITIVVPDGIEVAMSGFALMGGKSSRVRRAPALPATPRVNVRARVLMGGVTVVGDSGRRRRGGRR